MWNIIGDSFAIAIILKTEEQKSQKQEPKMSVHNTTITIKTILNKQLDRNLDKKKTTTKIPVWMNLSCDALAAPPSSGLFFVEDEVDDDEDDVDEQIGATKTTYDTDFIYNIEQNLYGTKVDDQITAVKNWYAA